MTEGFARHLMVDFTQMKSFAEDPLVIDRGEGIRVTDDRGRTYLDGLSGSRPRPAGNEGGVGSER